MNVELHEIALSIFNLCVQNRISLDVQWVPRSANDCADFVSRLIDTDDWSISPSFLAQLSQLWGPFSADCFATHHNAKLPRFLSRFWNPGTSSIDAFVQDWHSENCLLVPPVVLMPSVLKHFNTCVQN